MTDAKRYTVGHPLGFYEAIHCARQAVREALGSAPEVAASSLRRVGLALLPAHARGCVDSWQPRTLDDWARLGAYDGLVDAWEGSAWRSAHARKAEDVELYTASYMVTGAAARQEVGRARDERKAAG